MIKEMARFHLEPKRLQFVHSHDKDEARLILVEALKEGQAQVRILPPFILYDSEEIIPLARSFFEDCFAIDPGCSDPEAPIINLLNGFFE